MNSRFSAVIGMLFLLAVSAGAATDSISVSLDFGPLSVVQAKDGLLDVRAAAGFENSARPARPSLPQKTFFYALPPDVDPASVAVVVDKADYRESKLGKHVRPAEPLRTSENSKPYFGDANTVVNGKDSVVYESDADYPASPVRIDGFSQMRKWEMVRVVVTPALYNPVRGNLKSLRRLEFRIVFQRLPQAPQGLTAAADTVMDADALQLVANGDQVAAWYATRSPQKGLVPKTAGVTPGTVYLVMTTDRIFNETTNLYGLITFKQKLGYAVHTVTETKVDGIAAATGWNEVTGQAPNEKADRMRKWLQNNYVGMNITYVLLVGNPDPASGDLPMKRCYITTNTTSASYYEYRVDSYYSDLSGNWDLNTNGFYGEETMYFDGVGTYVGDDGIGGVDFAPEVLVGRIPVYDSTGWQAALKKIAWKIVKYELESNTGWRKSALLPESWSDLLTDGAYLGECARTNFLAPKGYSSYTMYEQGSVNPSFNSIFPSDEELLDSAVANRWMTNSYGITLWWAHGWAQGAQVYSGGGTLFQTYQCPRLKDETPSVLFMASCSCGDPRYDDNISYSMLKNGGIASVAASEVSWYYGCSWNPGEAKGMNASMGYDFMRKVVSNEMTFGQAFAEVKTEIVGWLNNKLTFNLFGDPSLSIVSQGTDTDSDGMPDVWEIANAFSLNDPSDAGADPDVDGYRNLEEYNAGSDPRVWNRPLSDYSMMSVAATFNGWNPAANNLRLVSDYTWQGDLSLTNQSGVAFKFVANGSWTTNWGEFDQSVSNLPMCGVGDVGWNDIRVQSTMNGRYRFTLNEQSGVYRLETAPALDDDSDGMPNSWEILHSLNPNSAADAGADPDHDGRSNLQECQDGTDPWVWNPARSGLASLSVAGTFSGWNPASSNMCLVSNYVWRHDATFSGATGVQFKFAANGGWATNWGDNNQSQFGVPMSGVGESLGANIQVTGTLDGSYRFTFYEQTLDYSLEAISTPDTDADGMSDAWEAAYGLNSMSSIDAYADADSDGVLNRDEFALGGDPAVEDTDGDGSSDKSEAIAGTGLSDSNSFFAADTETSPTNIVLLWTGAAGRVYDVYSATGALAHAAWNPVAGGTNLSGSTGAMSVSIPASADSTFFKVRVKR